MPARSKRQQRFMALCLKHRSHAMKDCPDMSDAQLREFAATPRKNLPERVGRQRFRGRRR